MAGTPQIVFVRFGKFSYCNDRIGQLLAANFPACALHTIDVAACMKRDPIGTFIGLAETVLRARTALFDRRRSLRANLVHFLVRSPWLRRRMKARLERRIMARCPRPEYIFFSQTLFDCEIQGVPTFVYTDSAALTNLYSENFQVPDLPPPAWLVMEKAALRRAALIFTWSHHVSRSMMELYHIPANRIVRVLAGCNLAALPAVAAPAPAESKSILFAGVDWDRKGGPWLVEAFRRLPERHRDATLVVVGCAPAVDVPNCTICGRVELSEMARFYRRAAIFCMPTKAEPFGIAFIEAMAHAVATLAPDMGAMPDYIEHGVSGLLHRPGDIDDIAARLTWLLDHPEERRRMAARGFDAVLPYRWENVGRSIRGAIEAYEGRNQAYPEANNQQEGQTYQRLGSKEKTRAASA
jgi:glycosyltransferase involved in cell wall biosynthesis